MVGYHCPYVSINPPGDNAPDSPRDAAPTVEELIAARNYDQAARTALEEGQPALAAELYEKAWDFRGALAAARLAGDRPRALRYAIEAHDDASVANLVTELSTTDADMRAALEVLTRMRRHADAAPLAEKLGEVAQAIELFRRARNDLEAARLLEAQGRDREAGQLLERALDLAADDEKAPLQLALGRILAQRGAYPEATRLLQNARKDPALRGQAQRHLIATLAAMGLRNAASDALLELRAAEPTSEITADLDAYVRAWRGQAPRPPVHLHRDRIAGRYRLERLLGAGSAGRVFLALDEVTGRSVAVKMFVACNARGSAAYERFVREARLASALRHPSLVEVYDVSVDQGFLVMEYLAGGSLAQRLAAGERLEGPQVRRMALEVIAGLEAAHHRGVVHRDIKPANVFFDSRGTAKLGDFGVAHLVDFGQTQTGGLIGTLAYMAPEQITGAPISIAADLYALGVTLFEVLAQRLPFLGPDFIAQHLGEPPPLVSAVAIPGTVDPMWDPIIAGMLVKNPDERTSTLAELRHQLEALDLSGNSLIAGLPRRESAPNPGDAIATQAQAGPRYQFETSLFTTAWSQLARAVDTVLDRSVVIERYDESEAAAAAMHRTRMLARAHSPFVQRALSLDVATRTAVFEAPFGAAIADTAPQLPPVELVRLLKRLARAAAAMHELGTSHGAIDPRTVVLDEAMVPTILAAGQGAVASAQPADDVAAILSVVAWLAGCKATFSDIAHALCGAVGAPVPAFARPIDGESLYAAADALDMAILSVLGA